MGQYYLIANIDKEEYISPHDFDCGVKLMEFSYQGNDAVNYMLKLMMDKWQGDRVYVVGDYADAKDLSENWVDSYIKACKDLNITPNADQADAKKLYREVKDNFTHLDIDNLGMVEPRYVYNTGTKTYLDLEHANIAWGFADKEGTSVTKYSNISILLAMGNDRGLGDYHTKENVDLAGSWCKYSEDLIVSDRKLDEYADYEEYNPNFHEQDVPIPYTLEEDFCRAMNNVYSGFVSKESYCLDTMEEYDKVKHL